jgi:2-(1,2-epoxy-1,2-dihydrophenyl)acetyl-CoA isomerase
MTEQLLESFDKGVATLTMNRPQALNAMTAVMMNAMGEAVARLAKDPKVRLLVLTGSGNSFCVGGDVKGFVSEPDGINAAEHDTVELLRERTRISELLYAMPKPTLAIIPGACAGAGLSLALACDMRMVVDTAKITTAFARIGTSGDFGGSWFLTQLVGAAKARELYFTGDIILGKQAYQLGLANRLVTAETLAEESKKYIESLANLPTVAIGYIKKNINLAQQGSLGQVLDIEAAHMVLSTMTEDHKSAVLAFIEKRPPIFKGC